jgi:regulator of sirC expression with transglutaminase-like and TPR domain
MSSLGGRVAEVKGVKGNKEDYYNPDNSCMDKLVEGGPGIPITMALLYMELARRCDFPMVLHNPREG